MAKLAQNLPKEINFPFPMQFIDLTTQQIKIKEEIDSRIQSVLAHGKYIMGPEVFELEERLADYVNIKHGISCSSGTDALLLALLSLGVEPGDAVFTSSFTFIATAEVISLLGATPVFVDIDPQTFNLDPDKLEKAIIQNRELKPKGIVTVDIFGLPCDYDRISEIANNNKLFIIEDGAQSLGGEYKGDKACSFGDIACTSFFPAKPLGCYGDGGMCFTNDDNLADVMRSLRVHGKGSDKYDNIRIGVNGRLDTLQAAILLAKFDIFPEEIELREKAAQRYNNLLGTSNPIISQEVPDESRSAWAQYSLLAKDEKHRTKIQADLKNKDIPSAIYYPKPLHLQTAFASLGYKEGDLPICEDYAKRIFSIPMHPYLTRGDQEKIIGCLEL